ncbi:nuclear transport factor 2 family protein [Sphingobium limneticum]|jgi:hypothetical protein|uniref:nuclear transport factor 2 family protein n=1 Tax=Sphingobium limneticum TaxID=1007511 RepID=UPI003D0568DE
MTRGMPSVQDMLALQDLENRYWAMADATIELAIEALFTHDAELSLGAMEIEGRDAIVRFFTERAQTNRATDRATRHVATNHVARIIDANTAQMRSTVLVFSGSGSIPLPVNAPSGIADFADICVRSGDGWKYRHRIATTIFIGEGAPSFARPAS